MQRYIRKGAVIPSIDELEQLKTDAFLCVAATRQGGQTFVHLAAEAMFLLAKGKQIEAISKLCGIAFPIIVGHRKNIEINFAIFNEMNQIYLTNYLTFLYQAVDAIGFLKFGEDDGNAEDMCNDLLAVLYEEILAIGHIFYYKTAKSPNGEDIAKNCFCSFIKYASYRDPKHPIMRSFSLSLQNLPESTCSKTGYCRDRLALYASDFMMYAAAKERLERAPNETFMPFAKLVADSLAFADLKLGRDWIWTMRTFGEKIASEVPPAAQEEPRVFERVLPNLD